MLAGVETLVPDGSLKLGFRAHYPQLETKLTVRGTDMEDVRRKLAPVEQEVRKRLGNFILAEDDQKLEGVVLEALARRAGLARHCVETFTGGAIAARIAPLPGAEKIFRRGIVARDLAELCAGCGPRRVACARARSTTRPPSGGAGRPHSDRRHARARGARSSSTRAPTGSTSAAPSAWRSRPSKRLPPGAAASLGGREWVRLGAVEMALDCLRRYLQGLPVDERIDFEKV